MKKLNRFITSLLCSLMMVTMVGTPIANVTEHTNGAQVAVVEAASKKAPKLNKKSVTLDKGKTAKLSVSNASGKVTWSSSKKSVATVNSSGKVTVKSKGKVTTTASGETVYITKTGKKYHRGSCQYLRQSKIKINLSEAKRRGYTKCSRC